MVYKGLKGALKKESAFVHPLPVNFFLCTVRLCFFTLGGGAK